MIKRDTIQRVVINKISDGEGGYTFTKEEKEIVDASVSIASNAQALTEFGERTQMMLNVATNIELDNYVNARYMFAGKMFKIMRQIKRGNEYFSVLLETNEQEAKIC